MKPVMLKPKTYSVILLGFFTVFGGLADPTRGLRFETATTIPQAQPTPALDLRDELALEAWVLPERYDQPGVRLIDKSEAGSQSGYMLDTFPGNSLRLLLAEGMLTAKDVLKPGEWTHVAGVFSVPRGIYKLYVNGKEVADASRAGMKPIQANQLPLRLGADSRGEHRFRGEMARATIYSRALVRGGSCPSCRGA